MNIHRSCAAGTISEKYIAFGRIYRGDIYFDTPPYTLYQPLRHVPPS